MAKGKFEVGRLPDETGKPRRGFDWLLIALPVLVLASLALILVLTMRGFDPGEGDDIRGYTKEELTEQFRNLSLTLEKSNMVLTLLPEDPEAKDAPIQLTVSPALSGVRVDLNGLASDLEEGVGQVSRRRFLVDPANYLSFDRKALQELAADTENRYAQRFEESFSTLESIKTGDEEIHVLDLNVGRRGVEISAEDVYQALMDAYVSGELNPTLKYRTEEPQPLDAEEIHDMYTIRPVDAELDMTSFRITPDVPGFGFELEELEELLATAEPGKNYQLTLRTLKAAHTTEDMEASLFQDVLADAKTDHVYIDDRTVNLMKACEAIDGKILMPGEVFSFNKTVGQRTEEKGYREATAYVNGASVPEIGGGVCQVASTIYYAVLQADLRTVERRCHTYLVEYVPRGMDAAIYWGSIDYKFENTSPTPIKIEASVHDGIVEVILRGREWKNYTVELHSETLQEIPWEEKEQIVTDGSYKNGATIVKPYTGYRVSTSKTLKDLDGNVIETVHIANSSYQKRDKVIAVVPPPPKETSPTESSAPNG